MTFPVAITVSLTSFLSFFFFFPLGPKLRTGSLRGLRLPWGPVPVWLCHVSGGCVGDCVCECRGASCVRRTPCSSSMNAIGQACEILWNELLLVSQVGEPNSVKVKFYSREMQTWVPHRNLCNNGHGGIFHNGQKVGITQMRINW